MELREGDAWLKHAETAAIICQQFLCLPVTPECRMLAPTSFYFSA